MNRLLAGFALATGVCVGLLLVSILTSMNVGVDTTPTWII